MQQAAAEVSSLRSAGSRSIIRDKNKPTALVIEQAINSTGLKPFVNKIESSGKDGARVTLKDAPFNQVLIWLNTLATYNGIQVVSANIDRGQSPGRADARLTFERP
jgi:type II secretory pathway component PulM